MKILSNEWILTWSVFSKLRLPFGDHQVCDHHRAIKYSQIPRIKNSMEHRLSYNKYYKYPSCDSEDWMFRYWGKNYNKLLTIKVSILDTFSP